jgi:CRISPR-associated protein Cas1
MTNRILDFSMEPARLSFRNGLLVIDVPAKQVLMVPIAEIAAVILGHPQISLTQAVLGQLGKVGIAVVCCDEKFRPSGMLLPMEAHHRQSQRFEKQAKLTAPRKKRLWQSIVVAKILSQAQVLEELRGLDYGLRGYARRVGSGDPGNVEAHAARRYWTILFAEQEESFRRTDEDDVRNHLLDYGYAVLRSVVARCLCASGLHPSFGIHHRSPYNTFPLADDVMEPFRPAIDRVVFQMARELAGTRAGLRMDPESKRRVITAITDRYYAEDEQRTLLDLIQISCQRLAHVVEGCSDRFEIPLWRTEVKKRAARALSHHVDVRDVRSAG